MPIRDFRWLCEMAKRNKLIERKERLIDLRVSQAADGDDFQHELDRIDFEIQKLDRVDLEE